MAVKLRLRREGTKKTPHYRIVAADHRSPRDGRFIEIIGHYHPLRDPSGIEVDGERALHWLRSGAQPTAAVEKLLRISGVWEEFKPGDEPARDRSQRERVRVSKKQREKQREAAEAAVAPAVLEQRSGSTTDETAAEEPSESDATEESSE
jgi:small subunit ribosomal protein S16